MKMTKILYAGLILSNLMVVAACDEPTDSSSLESSTPSEVITPSESSSVEEAKVKFEDKVVDYDGTVHTIEVQNLPEGAKVKYTNNEQVEPGKYEITAKVTYADRSSEEFKATLTIEKLESTITAEAIQEAIHNGKGALPTYSIDNDEQKINVQKIITPGSYELILYATESAHYKESNHLKVNFTVRMGNSLGIVYNI